MKLSADRTFDRRIAQQEAMEIASVLSEGKCSKANKFPPSNNARLNPQKHGRPLTPKERMKIRKQQRADQEMERLKKLTVKTYNENRRECTDIKKRFEHSSADDFDDHDKNINGANNYGAKESQNIRIDIIDATKDEQEESYLDVYDLPADDNVFNQQQPLTPKESAEVDCVRAYTHCFGEDEDETLCHVRKYTHCFGGEDTTSDDELKQFKTLVKHSVEDDAEDDDQVFDDDDEDSDSSGKKILLYLSLIHI